MVNSNGVDFRVGHRVTCSPFYTAPFHKYAHSPRKIIAMGSDGVATVEVPAGEFHDGRWHIDSLKLIITKPTIII